MRFYNTHNINAIAVSICKQDHGGKAKNDRTFSGGRQLPVLFAAGASGAGIGGEEEGLGEPVRLFGAASL